MKLYLAGPMSGHKHFNHPAFHKAASDLRAAGYEVFNPAENFGGDTSLSFATYMRECIPAILKADVIVVLEGWRNSRGATFEVVIGDALDIPVRRYSIDEGNVFLWDAHKEPR